MGKTKMMDYSFLYSHISSLPSTFPTFLGKAPNGENNLFAGASHEMSKRWCLVWISFFKGNALSLPQLGGNDQNFFWSFLWKFQQISSQIVSIIHVNTIFFYPSCEIVKESEIGPYISCLQKSVLKEVDGLPAPGTGCILLAFQEEVSIPLITPQVLSGGDWAMLRGFLHPKQEGLERLGEHSPRAWMGYITLYNLPHRLCLTFK